METDTITVISMLMGSWLTIILTILWQSNRHDDKINALDTKFTGAIQGLDTKFTGAIEGLSGEVKGLSGEVKGLSAEVKSNGRRLAELSVDVRDLRGDVGDARERLARVEGYLTSPGGFAPRHPRHTSADDPPADEPASDRREAG